jgi:hypothetical protein
MAWDVAAIMALITALMPIIDQVIKWIEKLFPKGTGAAKKAKATEVLAALMPAGATKGADAEAVVSKLIDQRVAALNETGVLRHKKKATA